MATTVSLSLACCLLLVISPVARSKVIKTPVQFGLEFGPQNVAVLQGATVELRCITDGVPSSNVQWVDPVNTLISDGSTLIESHPNRARYSLNLADSRTFNLVISNVVLADAGFYTCRDSNAAPPSIILLEAELIVLESNPICNATYPYDTGAVVEGQYHTVQCIQSFQASPGIRPLMTWTGPPPFNYGYSFNNNTVWSGVSFYADRSMDARNWICKTNFTDDQFVGPNRDTSAPDYSVLSPSNQIFVFWGPTNMTAYPIQASYEIGQTVSCYADSWPRPTYVWQSLRTSEQWYSISFTTREDMVGYQLMRCTAANTILGFTYTRDFFLDVYVNPATTPTTTTPAPTTTTPAPWGECSTLTGMWRSTNPVATLCITVDTVDNGARLTGLFKNGTDTFWMNIVGKTRVNNYNTAGWTMIFPQGLIGVASYAAECHSCSGTEQILANGISRTTRDSQFCAAGGSVNSSPEFRFFRVPPVYPCTSQSSEMRSRMALNANGKLFAEEIEQ